MRATAPAALMAVLAVLAAACGAGTTQSEVSPPSSSPTAAEASPALANRCVNDGGGYAVHYPDGWETNTGEIVPACRLFDPDPIEIEPYTELPFSLAVSIRVADIAFDDRPWSDDLGQDVLEAEDTEVDGRRAVAVRTRGTGEALVPEDMDAYHYYVDVDGGTLIGATYEAGDLDFEDKTVILDDMMGGLDLLGG